jgi:hypothetical protein
MFFVIFLLFSLKFCVMIFCYIINNQRFNSFKNYIISHDDIDENEFIINLNDYNSIELQNVNNLLDNANEIHKISKKNDNNNEIKIFAHGLRKSTHYNMLEDLEHDDNDNINS